MPLRNTLLLFCSILFSSLFIPIANALPTTKKEWDKCLEKVSKEVNLKQVGNFGLEAAIKRQCGYAPVEETASMISGIGVSPNQLVRSKKWKKKFMDITKEKYTDLIDSLLLGSQTTLENGWIFGYGCKPHFCGSDNAAFAINVSSGNVFVAMNENNTISGFGFDSSWENAPEPLKEWKRQLIAGNNYETSAPIEETTTTEEIKVDYFSLCTNGNVIACTKLCEGGLADSCGLLGIFYHKGQGVKQDYFKAKEFYEKACDGGNAGGCSLLGNLYLDGKGVKQDYLKAKDFCGKACNGGNAGGCNFLGLLHEYGKGVKQDYFKAKEFYGKACDLKDQLGCESYARLNK